MKTNQRNQNKRAEAPKTSIRKGDLVVVTTGKDKGKKGKVIYVNPLDGTCVVENVNMVTKHKKARSAQQKSARVQQPGAINISNVQILCKCGKATRVGHVKVGGFSKRVCVKCKEVLDKKFVKPKVKEDSAEEVKNVKDKAVDGAEGTEKEVKKPLVRREVKHTADVKIKKPANSGAPSAGSTNRKMGS